MIRNINGEWTDLTGDDIAKNFDKANICAISLGIGDFVEQTTLYEMLKAFGVFTITNSNMRSYNDNQKYLITIRESGVASFHWETFRVYIISGAESERIKEKLGSCTLYESESFESTKEYLINLSGINAMPNMYQPRKIIKQ